MRMLLDTHIALWYLNGDTKLSSRAVELINSNENTVYFSTASMWEITIKHANHPTRMELSGRKFWELCRLADFRELPISHEHVLSLVTLERDKSAPPHNDPFDRIMLAQSKAESLRFITHDALISHYNEQCILMV